MSKLENNTAVEPGSGTEILDVDLLAFETGSQAQRKAVIDGVMRSLTTGFVYTRSDLPEQLLDETYEILKHFFALDAETKSTYHDSTSQGSRGYTGLLVETAAISETPDWKEMLNWGEQLPAGHPLAKQYPRRYLEAILPRDEDTGITGSAEVLAQFHSLLVQLQTRFLRIIALGIGVHENYFDAMVNHGSHLTRAIRYPPMNQAPTGANGNTPHRWAEEHGDINLITALPRATARGLQVLVGSQEATSEASGGIVGGITSGIASRTGGRWIDAAPPDGYVIINSGILMEHITNGLIPIGWHRVVADKAQTEDRLSVVQFCHPTPGTILMPASSTITPERPCRFPALSAEDRLLQVLWEINMLDDARRVSE